MKIAYKKKKTNGKQYAGVFVGEVHFLFYCIFETFSIIYCSICFTFLTPSCMAVYSTNEDLKGRKYLRVEKVNPSAKYDKEGKKHQTEEADSPCWQQLQFYNTFNNAK